jgi:diguanylate cyclase (GGDEF)-like protein
MRKRLYFLGLAALLLAIFVFFAIRFFSFTPRHQILKLEKGWTVTYHNQQYLNTNLEKLSRQTGASFSRGDMVYLNQTSLLEDIHAPFPYLVFKTRYCLYEVYLDNELICSTMEENHSNKEFVGAGYNFVLLPKDYAGKRLSIKLFVTENSTRADIIAPMIGDFDDVYRYMIHEAMFPFIIGLFLIMFGVVFLVISLLFYIRSSGGTTQILCSFLNIVLGCWMLAGFDIVDFVLPLSTATTIKYCSMYLITPLLYAIVFDLHRRKNNKILMIMGLATFIFSLSFIAMHLFNIVHINHFQFPYYLISSVSMAILFAYDYIDIKSKTKNVSKQLLMGGVTFLATSLLTYVIWVIIRQMIDYKQNPSLNYVLPTGAMMFVFMQLLNYFVFMAHSFAQKKEYAALTKIAYVDNLTGLPNRVSCDEKLAEFDKSGENFCLLSLDLNGLKEVNDNAGHPAGDKLLKDFADTLADVIGKLGVCTRIGGDEFLVLIKETTSEELDKLLKVLDERLLELDKIDQDVNHSVSYGYAFREETPEKDTHSVFMLADKRMYDYKRAHYANMMTK